MLETKRLIIKPLSLAELELYYNSPAELANSIGFFDAETEEDDELKQIIADQFLPTLRAGDSEYLFFTLWLIVLKATNEVVASLCFHSAPQNGVVEVGYGTYAGCKNKGYMTEALQALIQWAKQREDICRVTAEVIHGNNASARVLIKNGFELLSDHEQSAIYAYDILR